jgi:hypothetical protein
MAIKIRAPRWVFIVYAILGLPGFISIISTSSNKGVGTWSLVASTAWIFVIYPLGALVLLIGKDISYKITSRKRMPTNNGIQKADLLRELYNAEKEYNIPCFNVIKELIEQAISKEPQKIIAFINSKNATTKEWIHSTIGNVSGRLLESGRYHIYRGVLDITGNYLLEIYDKSYQILLGMNLKHIDSAYAKSQKEILRKNISVMG